MVRNKERNDMRSPEEKERIVLESYEKGRNKTAQKYDICPSVLRKWRTKYSTSGLDGLVSKTGRSTNSKKGNQLSKFQRKKILTKEEQLELENLKLKIEVTRLKKGYLVKGVGTKKEYVTIKDSNTKF